MLAKQIKMLSNKIVSASSKTNDFTKTSYQREEK